MTSNSPFLTELSDDTIPSDVCPTVTDPKVNTPEHVQLIFG